MSGFFGAISKQDCIYDVFYGTDYHSHLGTKRAGMVFYNEEEGFRRSIHSLEDGYFRTKFEPDLDRFSGNSGIGVISDTDPQPIMFNSHMGRFAITTVCRMVNIDELEQHFLRKKWHFAENFQGNVNPTEVVANLICEEDDFVAGIENVFSRVKGSCTMMILTPESLLVARDKLGRTTAIIGKKMGPMLWLRKPAPFPIPVMKLNITWGPARWLKSLQMDTGP